ncbi:penicillin-binding protein 1C [Roseomonas sp. OT10]|uniref:penicillin-binding protein 1C n=1 Tax=Roseomonas cutis TaxID=2897332 RepID=UPI001E31B0A9|nr:penicillin-binding protein 1C [Roseomonas sp. OT10]UFN50750.1 penicillin-binding protein 1C [Roseomonas sp. OT10]
MTGARRSGDAARRLACGAALGLAGLLGAGLALDAAFPPDLSRVESVAHAVRDREGRLLSALPAPGGVWRLPTMVEDVPPHLVELLIAAEDRRFRRHPGIDPLAMLRAAGQWLRAGRVVSGGSTLSMQAARLLEPRPRNLRSKAIEAFRAVQLEARHGKAGVLRIWLTLAPMGGNLEGVRAGALAWFGREARQLDPAESALLVALPRRPEALRPDRHPAAARAARDALLTSRAASAPGITAADRALLAEDVPQARQPMPALAPHLSREVVRDGAAEERTTLDAGLQRALEALLAEARRDLPPRASIAAVVADLRSREIRALAGGAWGEEARAGALDLTRAWRSPGSALKPLLYALAFEAGLARPDTPLDDAPTRFGGYAPENFDHGFVGRVSAADALRRSLNLPAVALLDRLGPRTFLSALKAAGVAPMLPPGADASLPLALGGVGVTLRELVGATAALGDGGRAGRLVWREGQAGLRPAIGPRAAGQVAAILTRPFPGGGPAGIAWKTGTSWGGRDALAVGFDAAHVAGIWAGRPDGTPLLVGTGAATGTALALPLLARTFALLPAAPRPVPAAPEAAPTPIATAGAGDRLRLLFPPPGAQILAEGDAAGVTLRALGGRRPLTFLVDGVPLPSLPARRETAWAPPGPGFYRVTVLDAEGAAVSVPVRVRGEARAPAGAEAVLSPAPAPMAPVSR